MEAFKISHRLDDMTHVEALAAVRAARANVKPESIKYALYQFILTNEPTFIRRDGLFVTFEWNLSLV